MLSARGVQTPTLGRRLSRRRPVAVLAALTAAACLSGPLTGWLPTPTTTTGTPLPAAGHDDNPAMYATSQAMWADPVLQASRMRSRVPASPWGFSDALKPNAREAAPGEGTELHPLSADFPWGDPALLMSPYVAPVPGPITSPFGPRFHPILHYVRNHNGVDMTAACGTPVVAMTDGRVTRAAWAGGYGLLVEIDHGTVDEDRVSTRYAHLSVLGVTVGQKVSKGQQIGLAGTTGLSTGCHLHFEVIVNGAFVDPRAVLSGAPFARLDTPMTPWVPGVVPPGPVPTLPPTESGPLPDLDEVPVIPADPTLEEPLDPQQPTPEETPTPDPSPSMDPTVTPSPDPTVSPSPEPTPSPSPHPTPSPSPDPTPTATPSPTPTPTATATPTPTSSATATSSATPTSSARPTASPSATATAAQPTSSPGPIAAA